MKTLGWLLGLENVTSIDKIDPSLAAAWVDPFYVFFGLVVVYLGSFLFYAVYQQRGSLGLRLLLAAMRGTLLAMLFLTLANPVLRIDLSSIQNPLLYFVFDGTDSMAIEDEYPEAEHRQLLEAVAAGDQRGGESSGNSSSEPSGDSNTESLARLALVKRLLKNDQVNLLERISRERGFRVEAFVFDGNTTSQLRKLALNEAGEEVVDAAFVAEQLTSHGQVTALGSMLLDAAGQFGAGQLSGVVIFSDFAQNSGTAPLGSRTGARLSPASRLGVPIYTVGVGATETLDLAVDLQTDPKMKRAEKTNVLVKLRQSGLQGREARVRVIARRLSGQYDRQEAAETVIGQQTVTLESSIASLDFPFTPEEAGRFEFVAEAEPLSGEVVEENNRVVREVNIIDDYLRLMYVAFEPTWEWRFVKEVFHRDKLVGMQGFRTYLASSDPQVRESNVLFLPTLTPRRSDFFANDVLFLGDMPRQALSDRFCEMVKEFVGNFGGGLVVIAGPRFGPAELDGTPLADLLPVIVDRDARYRDEREFRLRLTANAERYPFMQLGGNDVEDAKAWSNLGKLPWYQPVAQLHPQGIALAEHPSDVCRDGNTPQPLIAVRQYGAGEVVYLAHNEMWRLRRLYGEQYYRQFWSQLIYRLGMSHALGSEKRFVVRTDRQQYRSEEKVLLTVEAYDENFEPLTEDKLSGRTLDAEILVPSDRASQSRELAVPMLRDGVFEARVPVFAAGEYTIRIKDPVSNAFREVRFDVTSLSAERRSGVRDLRLQEALAAETNGRSYDLTTVAGLADDLPFEPIVESYTRNHPLWSTPLWFILLVGLMLGEWLIRKTINLA